MKANRMESTLTNGDTVLIQKMSYYFGDPKRYDVVSIPGALLQIRIPNTLSVLLDCLERQCRS